MQNFFGTLISNVVGFLADNINWPYLATFRHRTLHLILRCSFLAIMNDFVHILLSIMGIVLCVTCFEMAANLLLQCNMEFT